MIKPVSLALLAASLSSACSHPTGFEVTVPATGPSGPGPDVRLTYDSNQNYWPVWSADGAGILYSYIPASAGPEHRCLGLLPGDGGARIWQLCDNRAIEDDSINSIPAYALGMDGQLLYLEAAAPRGPTSIAPARVSLFLADTAHPFARRTLLSFPTTVTAVSIDWLADIVWTGPGTFLALAQEVTAATHCHGCEVVDTLFIGRAVVRGTINDAGAALEVVTGTTGATGYSVAEDGASIVFVRRDDRALHKVPFGGGSETVIATVTPSGGSQLLGVSCKGSLCVVASAAVTLTTIADTGSFAYPSTGLGPMELRGVSLTTGAVQLLHSFTMLVATPQISPLNGDVVAQVGGAFGHIQSTSSGGSSLHLLKRIVP